MTFIDEVTITDKTILLRVDFNVPLSEEMEVLDDARIRYALPTIKKLLDGHNRLILLSHLGKPKGRDLKLSLKPITASLQKLLPNNVFSLHDSVEALSSRSAFKEGEIRFLENIRFWPEEKSNDLAFSQKLALLGDCYVTDAFSVCHRNDASVIGIPALIPSYGGLQLKRELQMFNHLLHEPKKPFVAVLGGSKVSTKMPLIKRLATLADSILIGGGMANTFFKAQGYSVGKSLYEADALEQAKSLLSELKGKIVLPTDVIACDTENLENLASNKSLTSIADAEAIYDIGHATSQAYREYIHQAQTIVWNGPVGFFEKDQYRIGTDVVYEAIVSNPEAFAVLGGGDTLSAIKDKDDKDAIDHISTGGGAMLSYLAYGTLPGIEALHS